MINWILTGFLTLTIFALNLALGYCRLLREYERKVKIVESSSTKKCERTVKEYAQAPGPKPVAVLGSLHLVGQFSDPFQGFTELAKKYGNIYTLYLGTARVLVVSNLELIREVLNRNGRFFGGRPDFLRYHKLFGGDRNNSLALCDWSSLQQKRRNLARKHFSPNDASSYFQKMNNVACFEMEELMTRLGRVVVPGQNVNLKPLIMQTVCNMFCEYMASIRFDYDDPDFAHMVRCFDEIFWEINQGYAVDFLPWLAPFYSRHMSKLMSWSQFIRTFILQRIVTQREEQLPDSDEPDRDFTDALLKSLREDASVERDTVIFMLEDFLGGHSAVGNLVMLALGYIVKHPEVGRRIQEELGDRRVTLDDMQEMPYLQATINEVLRKSSSPIVPHVATEDCVVAGYGVPKGTIVFINNFDLNTSDKYWDEPELFCPERFLEERGGRQTVRKNIPHFLPFSIGKRTCIGQNLVRGFSFIMLAHILQSYDVSSTTPSEITMKPACVAVPPDTYSIALTPRGRP